MHPQYNTSIAPSTATPAYYHPYHDQYFATHGTNFHGSFSRRSPLAYPYQDYRYMSDRGGPSSAVAVDTVAGIDSATYTSTTTTLAYDATGLAFTETGTSVSGSEYCHPEELSPPYEHPQGWQWEYHSTTAPLPPLPQLHGPPVLPQLPNTTAGTPPDPPFLDLASTNKTAVTVGQSQNYPLRSPTAQLPTPAAMAVLLNPNGRGREQTPQLAMDTAAVCLRSAPQLQSSLIPIPSNVADATAGVVIPVPDTFSREKKHACTMCHKRFDRPSTLRKHLLVHTGEKAFVCETCGRRFGVASNLNRHVRRCILKPVNAAAAATTSCSPPSSLSSPSASTSGSMPAEYEIPIVTAKPGAPKRGRASSSTGSTSTSSSSSPPSSAKQQQSPAQGRTGSAEGGTSNLKPPGQKRRRRAPSPSLWVPWSLRAFNLTCEEFYQSAPVPLPPVRRSLPKEERDSWDENVSTRPYHPNEWKGVLPGPGLGHGLGLGGKDVRNINFGGSGGIMLGRVLVC